MVLADNPNSAAPYVFLPPEMLLPSELHSEARVEDLIREIEACGRWLTRIPVEIESRVVMDGHHRRQVALRLSLSVVPCALLSRGQAQVSSRRPEFSVTPEEIIARGRSGDLYPEKTTRHVFDASLDLVCDVPLAVLRA